MDTSSFVEEIIANPHDDVARLVFADFLEEQEDPRAEMIRLQFELAELDAFDPRRRKLRTRELKLLREHGIFGKAIKVAQVTGHHGGFIDAIKITVARFLKFQDEIFQQAPVREVTLKSKSVKFGQIKDSKWLSQLSTFRLENNEASDSEITELMCSPELSNLKELDLRQGELSGESVAEIARESQLTSLQSLRLSGWHRMDRRAAEAIAASPVFSNLRELDLHGPQGDRGLVAIANSEHLHQLQTLDLSGDVMTTGVNALRESAFASRLKSLALVVRRYDTAQGDRRVCFPNLKEMNFVYGYREDREGVTPDFLEMFLQWCPCLEVLNLSGNELTDAHATVLSESPILNQLKKLVLTQNSITIDGVRAIVDSPHYRKGLKLYLRSNNLRKAEILTLKKEFGKSFGNLETDRELKWRSM